MEWNDIQSQWQEHSAVLPVARPSAAERLRRQVKRRDFLESSIALLMLPIFLVQAWASARSGDWLSSAFALLIVAAMVGIPWQLWRTRRLAPSADHQLSALEFLRAEQRALTAQARQLHYAWLWYFLPIGIGVSGMQFAIQGITKSSMIYAGIVALLGVFIDRANRVHAAPKFQRMATVVEQQIKELEET